jgi:hypothetical protein
MDLLLREETQSVGGSPPGTAIDPDANEWTFRILLRLSRNP